MKTIHSIRDLKGKRVGIQGLGVQGHTISHQHGCLCRARPIEGHQLGCQSIPTLQWSFLPTDKIDAFLGFPPEPQELRARKIGHVIVNSSIDRPWSQYFCCMLAGNRDFVRKNPVATKRVLRAILKAADFCASDPAGVARRMVDAGFTSRYDYAFQSLREVPYYKWREYEPEDTHPVLFTAVAARPGMIKSNPQQNHRRRRRLALPQRAQTGAEGLNGAHRPTSGATVTAALTQGRIAIHRVISVRCGICYRGKADIDQAAPIKLDL